MSSYPRVSELVAGSPAAAAGLAVGDELISIQGVVPSDVIEYQQLVDEEDVDLTVRRGGMEWDVTVAKGAGEPLGLRLDSSVFDRVQTCDNHCEFCFIYQLPSGMRRSLYLKDDDYRLSFLYGNFTTLTRFTELDLARIVDEQLSPLYVSIHSTDPTVRERMLRNRRGATSLRWLAALLAHGIEVHGQIVLCPGVNDGTVLERTLAEILVRYSGLASVGIVPLGLSRFNEEQALRVHTEAEARAAVELVHGWQEVARNRLGRRLFFASDELYLQAGVPVPAADAYEGFPQHENGIGMARAFYDEVEALEAAAGLGGPIPTGRWQEIPGAPAEGYRAPRTTRGRDESHEGPAVVITGEYGAAVLEPVLDRLATLADRELRLLPIKNTFFGGNIAVSGLLVGFDVGEAVAADTGPAGVYLLPDVTLSGDLFLDDVPLEAVAARAPAPLRAVTTSALGLAEGARR